MHFHPVETGIERVARSDAVVLDQRGDFVQRQGTRFGNILEAVLGVGLAFCANRAGRDRHFARRQHAGVRDAAHMPELQHDLAAMAMHCIGDRAPAGNLLLAVDARRVQVALAERTDLRAFGNDQPGGGTLAVVVGGQWCRHLAGSQARLRVSGAMMTRLARSSAPRRTGENSGDSMELDISNQSSGITRKARRRGNRGAPQRWWRTPADSSDAGRTQRLLAD